MSRIINFIIEFIFIKIIKNMVYDITKLPDDVLLNILDKLYLINDNTLCSSIPRSCWKFYYIYHIYVKYNKILFKQIIKQLCINGNITYLKYLINLRDNRYDLFNMLFTIEHIVLPAELDYFVFDDNTTKMLETSKKINEINYVSCQEIIIAYYNNNPDIIDFLTTLLPEKTLIILTVHSNISVNLLVRILNNNKIIPQGLSMINSDTEIDTMIQHIFDTHDSPLILGEKIWYNMFKNAKIINIERHNLLNY